MPRSLRFLLSSLTLAVFAVAGSLLFAPSPAQAQEMAGYYETADFLGAPPATFREGLLGSANPALPALTDNHLVAAWSTDGRRAASVQDWGLFGAFEGLGASVLRRTQAGRAATGYRLSLADGSTSGAVGVGYQGFAGDATALGRYNRLTIGGIARPSSYLTVGLTGNVSVETDDREVVGEVGLRPFGSSRFTVFGDAAWADGEAAADVPWSAGAAVEVVPGVNLRGRVFETEAVTVGLRVELGQGGLDSQSRIDPDGTYAGQTHRVRVGAPVPSAIAEAVQQDEKHVEMTLQEPLPYRTPQYDLFGSDAPRFYEVLRTVDRAAESDRVSGIALNLSGFQVSPEQAWELRTALREAQSAGTTIVAVLENASMTTYHLASVADVVALDPQGSMQLPGYAMSRTFLKGTLNKLGLGVQEWRFFEYKSAFESFSRTDFSRADSLQRTSYVDDQYELTQGDVTAARPLSADSLDRLVDEKVILTAQEARSAGLADTLARWHERDTLLADAAGEESSSLDVRTLDQIATASYEWGAQPEIAVVYGLGPTQVADGMNSRALSEKIRTLAEDEDVAAVVFRVDSPGGSPVAAAQVGAAVKECAEQKPVIVSQGQVAGSGGYWVSTHADTILAGPNTVTGSIGVIGGWIYDDGFSDKTGLSSDVVQRGERADLFEGIQVPLLGTTVPTRKLTEEELDRVESVFRQGYSEFVKTVAEGRDTTEAHIREVGEGRIYSGLAGKDVGLVDEIGGLPDAIRLARTAAGLGPDEVDVREVNPTSSRLGLASLLPSPIGSLAAALRPDDEPPKPYVETAPTTTFLRIALEHQPGPLVLLPPDANPRAR